MFRRLGYYPTAVVEPFAPSAPADLMEIPRAQDAGLLAVILAQAREQHGADGDVDADAEGVRAADDFEQALLRQLLDQHPVLRQQPGVVQPDPVLEPFSDIRTVGAGELEAFDGATDGVLLFARADVDAGEVLRALGRLQLREVDDIDGGLALSHEAFERGGQRQLGIGVLQRHRPILGCDGDGRAPVEPGQFFLEKGRIAQRGGHQQEPRLRQGQQRHLPRHAALAVGVVMEFVHDDLLDVGLRAFAQGDVGKDLGGAAEDWRIAVDRRIAGAQADVVGTELTAQPKPLLVHQGFDRTGIDGAFALGDGLEMHRGGNQ